MNGKKTMDGNHGRREVKVKVCLLLHVPNCFSTAKFLRLGKHHSSTQ